MAKKTSKGKKRFANLTLHDLIGAVSYWGTATRMILAAFLLFGSAFIRFLDGQSQSPAPAAGVAFTGEALVAIYALAVILVFDAGYVSIARISPCKAWADRLLLLGGTFLLLVSYLLPYYVQVGNWFEWLLIWMPAIVIGVVAVRLLQCFLRVKPVARKKKK